MRIRKLVVRSVALLTMVGGSSVAALSVTTGPASAATSTTSCAVLSATASLSTGAVSGTLSRCGDKAVTGGGGTFSSTIAFTSGTIAWNSGGTSVLTGAPSIVGTCGKGGKGTEAMVSGTVTGGNTLVGDAFSATACALPNKAGTALKVSLVKGTGGFVI